MHIRSAALCLFLAGSLGACGESADKQAAAPEKAEKSPAWLLASLPSNAVDVAKLKSEAKEGDKVVLRGKIGGRMEPMSDDLAAFVVMDNAIPSCADMEEDHCPTPWDYFGETPDSITTNLATVQVVGEDGMPLTLDLTEYGFEPLDEVVVIGVVGPRPSDEVLTVNAMGVYREGS